MGVGAEQLEYPTSVAVDLRTGAFYVLEDGPRDYRVDRYDHDGRFTWVIGKGVNTFTGGNRCTAQEVALLRRKCGAGAEASAGTIKPGVFKFATNFGDLLAVGGPHDWLYVGSEDGVQEFDAAGRFKGEIRLGATVSEPYTYVTGLALDGNGDLYVVYSRPNFVPGVGVDVDRGSLVQRLDLYGEPRSDFHVFAGDGATPINIDGITSDAAGRLVVIGVGNQGEAAVHFGAVYDGVTGQMIDEFLPPSDFDGIAINSEDDVYVAATDRQELVAYTPPLAVELLTEPVPCVPESGPSTFEALNCS